MLNVYYLHATPYFTLLKRDLIKENFGPAFRPKRKKLKGYQKSK